MKKINDLIRSQLMDSPIKSLDEKILSASKKKLNSKKDFQIPIFATLSILMVVVIMPQLKQRENEFVSIEKNIELLEYQDQMELMAQLGNLDENKIKEL